MLLIRNSYIIMLAVTICLSQKKKKLPMKCGPLGPKLDIRIGPSLLKRVPTLNTVSMCTKLTVELKLTGLSSFHPAHRCTLPQPQSSAALDSSWLHGFVVSLSSSALIISCSYSSWLHGFVISFSASASNASR